MRDHTSLFPALRGIRGDEAESQTSVREERELNKGRLLRTLVSKRTADAAEMKSKEKKSLLQVQVEEQEGSVQDVHGCNIQKGSPTHPLITLNGHR